jgi:hypothetical protein
MNIIAPPLTLLGLMLESDPTVMSKIPMKIMANAAKNNHVATENCEDGA